MRRDQTFKTPTIAGASDLTIIAPIKKGLVPALDAITYKTRVKRVLKLLQQGRTSAHEYEIGRVLSDAVERVGKIHSIRIAIIEPEDKLLLSVTFDGAWESYIRVIWQKVSRLLDLIFCNTEGYVLGWESTFDEWCAWLRSAQMETPFLYSQPNLTNTDTHYLRSFERIHRRFPDAEQAEIESLKFKSTTPEQNAQEIWVSGQDSNEISQVKDEPFLPITRAYRQSLRTLIALYKMSDVYLPTLGDGEILYRAAQELLTDLIHASKNNELAFDNFTEAAEKYYSDAYTWFFSTKYAFSRSIPSAHENEIDLITHKTNIQGGILKTYTNTTIGCIVLIAFNHNAGANKFLKKFAATSIDQQENFVSEFISHNISVTVEGLRYIGWSDEEIGELPEEFVQGMDKRQGVLGDLHINHPRRWSLPAANWLKGTEAGDESDAKLPRIQLSTVHVVVDFRANFPDISDPLEAKKKLFQVIKQQLPENLVTPLSLQWMVRQSVKGQPEKEHSVEHFGFRDADTNPTFTKPDTDSTYKNQVHLGEALLGYANMADFDPANGAKSQRAKAFLRNGSFLVVRKLRQNVNALNLSVSEAANKYGVSENLILSKMMGRQVSSATDSIGRDIGGQPLIGKLPATDNLFDFTGDETGTACPFQSHIRRANPREIIDSSEIPGQRVPRIIRRGMTYGSSFDKRNPDDQDRGLMFFAYNASIGEQFEVVQRWISGGNSTGVSSDQSDPFLGVAHPGRPRVYKFLHKDKSTCELKPISINLDGSTDMHQEPTPLVRLDWGMYFFTPSIPALTAMTQLAEKTASNKTVTVEWSADRGKKIIEDLLDKQKHVSKSEAILLWKEALEDPDAASDFKSASIWAAIRQCYGGVLETAYGVLVASQVLADQVLVNANQYLSAEEYLPRMRDSFGELYLGVDPGRKDQRYESEALKINNIIQSLANDFGNVQAESARLTHEAIYSYVKYAQENSANESKWQITIDIRDLIEHVIAHFCEEWFGLSDINEHFEKGGIDWASPLKNTKARYPGHFMAPSRYVFQPHPSDVVKKVAQDHGQLLRQAMKNYLSDPNPEIKAKLNKPVVTAILGQDLGTDYHVSTLLGLMMGFVPTTDGMMRRIAHEWLREGTLWSLRGKFEKADPNYSQEFMSKLLEAFRLRAAPELLWRTAKTDHQLGSGEHRVDIKKGQLVVLGQISVTHLGIENNDIHSYIYAFGDNNKHSAGKPQHSCPGRNPAMAVISGFLEGLISYNKYAVRTGTSSLTFNIYDEKEVIKHYFDYQILQTDYLEKYIFPNSFNIFAIGDSWVHQDSLSLTPWKLYNFTLLFPKPRETFYSSDPYFPDDDTHKKVTYSGDGSDSESLPVFNYSGFRFVEIIDRLINRKYLDNRIQKLQSKNRKVNLVLFSCGGNDLTYSKGENGKKDPKNTILFKILKPNATNVDSAFNKNEYDNFFNYIKRQYITVLSTILKNIDAPIFINTYDYPIPDGSNLIPFKKSKLFSVFDILNINYSIATGIMRKLINDLHEALIFVINDTFNESDKSRIYAIDFRGKLEKQAGFEIPQSDIEFKNRDGYKRYWLDEMHPTAEGYQILTAKLLEEIEKAGIIQLKQGTGTHS